MIEKPPWRWEKFDDSYGGLFWVLKDAEGMTIIHLVDEDYSNMTEQRMALIAAVPKMYELLVHIANDPDIAPCLRWRENIRLLLAEIAGADADTSSKGG